MCSILRSPKDDGCGHRGPAQLREGNHVALNVEEHLRVVPIAVDGLADVGGGGRAHPGARAGNAALPHGAERCVERGALATRGIGRGAGGRRAVWDNLRAGAKPSGGLGTKTSS